MRRAAFGPDDVTRPGDDVLAAAIERDLADLDPDPRERQRYYDAVTAGAGHKVALAAALAEDDDEATRLLLDALDADHRDVLDPRPSWDRATCPECDLPMSEHDVEEREIDTPAGAQTISEVRCPPF